ncbi:hypothetical protein L3X38_000436 [Prunus dulcis]|uniref:Activator of Hsp90 ATPase AHSA1-like N-terminal domain-containing protein n=1 Tax=Prunus dulcis TaxID=3755 RepID=A0AAD4WQA4_PRUDU|nr:hypothetical protein L3X38_000436 [Prunus dulcis]
MEGGAMSLSSENRKEEEQQGTSYTYWVRQVAEDTAPPPVPRKLSPQDILSAQSQPSTLGSLWNRAGTWEEKNVNKWATDRIKVCHGASFISGYLGVLRWQSRDIRCLQMCRRFAIRDCNLFDYGDMIIDSFLMSSSLLSDQAFLVTVRNKKCVSYTYELTLKVKGEWIFGEEKNTVKGQIDIPEFSFGELDDLQMEVRLSEEKDILRQDKLRVSKDLKLFLQPVREKLLQFEQELKDI